MVFLLQYENNNKFLIKLNCCRKYTIAVTNYIIKHIWDEPAGVYFRGQVTEYLSENNQHKIMSNIGQWKKIKKSGAFRRICFPYQLMR